jgi:hypothetical protein
MNDNAVLARIAGILHMTIISSKLPGPRTLPMRAVRIQCAKAYALLEVLQDYLVGLKKREAEAALGFFPPRAC